MQMCTVCMSEAMMSVHISCQSESWHGTAQLAKLARNEVKDNNRIAGKKEREMH